MAAYAEPGRRLAWMMTPALAHGVRPPGLVSEVIRAVMLPCRASGWCTK